MIFFPLSKHFFFFFSISKLFSIFNLNYTFSLFYSHDVLKKLENSYLSSSLTKLLDPTQAMFTGENALPTPDQIDSLIRITTK